MQLAKRTNPKPPVVGKLAVGEKVLSKSGSLIPTKTEHFVLKTENKLLELAFKEALGETPTAVFVQVLPQTRQGINYTWALTCRGVVYAETDGLNFWAMREQNGTLGRGNERPLKPETIEAIRTGEKTEYDILVELSKTFENNLPYGVKLSEFAVTQRLAVNMQIQLMPTPIEGQNLNDCYQIGAKLMERNGANSLLIQNQIVAFSSAGKGTANNFLEALENMQAYGLAETESWIAYLQLVQKKQNGKTWGEVQVTPMNVQQTFAQFQYLKQASQTNIDTFAKLSGADAPKLIE